MYNLDQVPVPSSSSKRRKPPPAVLFALESVRGVVLTDVSLRCRSNAHSYSSEVAVPFFGSPADDIVSLHCLLPPDSGHIALVSDYTLLFPISTLLKHVGTTNNRQPEPRHIQWDDCGALLPKTHHSFAAPNWDRNLLSGSRFLSCPDMRKRIQVWDFGRARVIRHRTSDSESVPFVREEVALPTEISGWVDVAIAEDVIVLYEASIIIAYLSISVQPICTFRVIFSPVTAKWGFIS